MDLIAGFASKLPLLVILEIMGVPREDEVRIHNWAGAIGANRGGVVPANIEPAYRAFVEFKAYVDEQVARLEANPDGNLLSILPCAARRPPDPRTVIERHQHPLRRPRDHDEPRWQRHLLTAHASLAVGTTHRGAVPRAQRVIEELLRFEAPVQFTARTSSEDTEIGGVEIPKGTHVIPMIAAATRPGPLREPGHARHHPRGQRPHHLRVRRAVLLPRHVPRTRRGRRRVLHAGAPVPGHDTRARRRGVASEPEPPWPRHAPGQPAGLRRPHARLRRLGKLSLRARLRRQPSVSWGTKRRTVWISWAGRAAAGNAPATCVAWRPASACGEARLRDDRVAEAELLHLRRRHRPLRDHAHQRGILKLATLPLQNEISSSSVIEPPGTSSTQRRTDLEQPGVGHAHHLRELHGRMRR